MSIKTPLTILLTLFFFLTQYPSYPSHNDIQRTSYTHIHKDTYTNTHSDTYKDIDANTPRRSLTNKPTPSTTLINYSKLSLSTLLLFILLHFHILITTANSHFSHSVTSLSSSLSLSPSLAAVSLLALGNGAPDVFASGAALRQNRATTGFSAILSAGAFVSALALGVVAIIAGPFVVEASAFLRDAVFYLVAAMFLFCVYLSGEIWLWQAVGFVGFYVFFVGVVVYMDLFGAGRGKKSFVEDVEKASSGVVSNENENGKEKGEWKGERVGSKVGAFYRKVSKIWGVPVSVILKLTIPQTSPSGWSRFYRSANIALCPMALLYACNSFMPINHPVPFLLSNTHLSLWMVVLFASLSLSVVHYILEKEPPKTEEVPIVLAAFVMSVFWISTTAGELLNCLEALGSLLKLPPSLLGLTVLAWGNSVGDLVADVAVAKAGQPAMAMAGCFAGPMFNMLVGLGMALVTQTARVYPQAYELHFNVSIVVAFVFLILSLMGSILVITWHRFRVPRFWGFCLVGLYVAFTALTLVIAKFSE